MQGNVRRQLSAILFADIVGYTAMMQQDEAEGIRRAGRFREALQLLVLQYHGELLEIRGDGALCTFGSAVEAVRCAQAIQIQLRKDVPLRIGIHLGDIVQNEDHIFGDAVNIASRIESMGIPGAVLLSSSIRQQIKNKPEFELHSLGRFAFKNVAEPMSVYALANEGFAVPQKENIQGKLKRVAKEKRRVQLQHLIWGLLIASLLGYLAWSLSQKENPETTDHVIAVIPFRDLSEGQDQEYFCEGVAEEILNALARIKGLTVRGRASSFSFKGKDVSLKEIATKLDANILLDGSIRKAGDKIRVNIQLLNAQNETPIWDQKFDKESGDIFSIQEEIAQAVINKLKITLLPGEKESLLAFQTQNPIAHDYYLKGIHALNAGARKAMEAIEHLEHAVVLDSSYYLAYTTLAKAYLLGGIYGGGKPYFEKNRFFAEKAVRINPNLPDAYAELAKHQYFASNDLEQAQNYYAEAVKRGYREPNTIQTELLVIRKLYAESAAAAEAMVKNDPFSVLDKTNQSRISLWSRDFQKTLEITEEILEDFPNNSSAMRHRGEAFLMLNRNDEAFQIFDKLTIETKYADYGKVIALHRLGREEESYHYFMDTRQNMHMAEIAKCFVEFEQADSALYYLENLIQKGEFGSLLIGSYGLLDPLHSDPHFQALRQQLGLPQ